MGLSGADMNGDLHNWIDTVQGSPTCVFLHQNLPEAPQGEKPKVVTHSVDEEADAYRIHGARTGSDHNILCCGMLV